MRIRIELGGNGHKPPDNFSSRSNFRSSFSFSFSFRSSFRSRSRFCSRFSVAAKATYIRLLHGKMGFLGGVFGPSSVKWGRTQIVLG